MITAKELKSKYVEFFKSKNHVEINSAPLIPKDDPSVLFNIAGMQPLMPFLMGKPHPNGKRIVDVQKCIRTVDFDNIGDNSHHTFFQMLGNWSLGDYFKKEAIKWSFEFLTSKEWLGLDIKKLAVSVYEGDQLVNKDEDAANYWINAGTSKERIAYLNAKENWWSMGETGPCGPDTEMFYWTSNEQAPEKFDPKDKRWVEIWNDVFMTYNKKEDGSLEPLQNKNIDTGMGFERVLAILNGKESAYETDLFEPIIKKVEELTKKEYSNSKREMRIIADHIRASVFLLSEKLVPSNVNQGYVLRRLIRRILRYLNLLELDLLKIDATVELAKEVINIYKEDYPELNEEKLFIYSELKKEEDKFQKTLDKGLREFNKIIENDAKITATEAFLLFQSYGFPIEMIEELAKEKNVSIDVKGFGEEFKKHQELSRKGAEQKFKGGLSESSETTTRLHTATHLLGEALRKVLNDPNIKQKGSNITSERLRYDFNFDRKLTDEEKKGIEDEINRVIQEGIEVKKEEMNLDDALNSGAQSEFGAKYPDKVSVYSVGDYSKEICMGPHVKNTKEIGKFKIKKEGSSAAGIRRIKAVLE